MVTEIGFWRLEENTYQSYTKERYEEDLGNYKLIRLTLVLGKVIEKNLMESFSKHLKETENNHMDLQWQNHARTTW